MWYRKVPAETQVLGIEAGLRILGLNDVKSIEN